MYYFLMIMAIIIIIAAIAIIIVIITNLAVIAIRLLRYHLNSDNQNLVNIIAIAVVDYN